MRFSKIFFAFFLLTESAAVLSSECLKSDEVYELYCNELASSMRVKLHALDSLRKNAKDQAKDAITWLERTVKTDQASVSALAAKPTCNTDNVKNAMRDADKYFSEVIGAEK